MRALANKFGAKLSFRHGESTGTIDLKQSPMPGMVAARTSGLDIGRALVDYNRACWGLVMKMYGLGKAS
jgi:hypothetical protein